MAVGEERIAVGHTIDDDIEALTLLGGVLLASDACVGPDRLVVFTGAGDVQAVAIAIIDKVLRDALAPATGPFVSTCLRRAAEQRAEQSGQQ